MKTHSFSMVAALAAAMLLSGPLPKPNTAAYTFASYKHVRMPDPKATPGVVLTGDVAVLSKPGYSKTVRHTSAALKRAIYAEYGVNPNAAPCPCEIDHFLPLEDGGADVAANLWPQPYAGPYGARQKDVVETWLHRQIVAGKITPAAALSEIRTWPVLYDRLKAGK